MLTETLLRAQERQTSQQRGSDQPDLPQEVPADSGSEQPHQSDQRPRISSSDFEPFEVIDEEVEGKGSHNLVSIGEIQRSLID